MTTNDQRSCKPNPALDRISIDDIAADIGIHANDIRQVLFYCGCLEPRGSFIRGDAETIIQAIADIRSVTRADQ